MICKSEAGYKHPGQKLRQVADDDKGAFAVPILNGKNGVGYYGQQAASAEQRVQEGAESALGGAVGEVFEVIEDGPRVDKPLVPA